MQKKILKFLKELATAYYDPNIDQIMNCKKGSLCWHHENRHLIQQHKYHAFTRLTELIWVGLVLIVLSHRWEVAGVILVALFIPEIDAWIYAFSKKALTSD